MASCGPPPRAAATPAAAAVTAAARAAATPGAAEIHATATPSIEQRYRQYKQLYFGGGFPRYSSSCPHPGFDIAIQEGERRSNYGQKMSPIWAYFTKLHRRFRPRDEPGQERHAAYVAGTAKSVVCTPTTVPRL